MSEILDLSQLLGPEPLHVDSWNIGQNSDDFDIMTALGVSQDYPDLDELLDIGDANDVVPNSTSSFDTNCIEIHDWYSDTSAAPHHQYGSQIEYEKDKKENEVGLLEALQKSMDMECETVPDLVCLSSSLIQPPLSSNVCFSSTLNHCSLPTSSSSYSPHPGSSLSPSTGDNMSLTSVVSSAAEASLEEVEDSDESVLKQLLLSQSNTNYPREVDSNNNSMLDHVAVNIVPKMADNTFEEHRRKKKTSKKLGTNKKPFTELLKHFESTNPDSASKTAKTNSTRVVNASRYQKQYGSTPVNRLTSPTEHSITVNVAPKVVKPARRAPVVSRTMARRQTIDVSLPLKKSSVAVSKSHIESSEKMIVAADANTLLDILENKSAPEWRPQVGIDCSSIKSRMLIDKRRSTVLIDPLPHKRQKINSDDKTTDEESCRKEQPECTEKPSAEHDYCQNKVSEPNSSDLLTEVLQASGLPSSQDENQDVGDDVGAKASKVLKWQDYLQRVRLGIRSAPNSPTCSPKIQRGSARVPNNFMVQNHGGVVKTTPRPVTHLVEPIVAAKAPKQKSNLKLQEFEEYLAKLQNKTVVSAVASSSSVSDKEKAPSAKSDRSTSHKSQSQKDDPILVKPKALPKRSRQVTVPNISSKSFVKISTNGVVHTAAVSSAQSSVTPLVMIQIPKMASAASLGTHVYTAATNAKYVSSVMAPTTSNGVASANNQLQDPRKTLKPKSNSHKMMDKPISKVKWSANAVTNVSQSSTIPAQCVTSSGETTKPPTSGPTFKLVTSNKGGLETKSLILSGVSGKLKEILTLLAQQQQQQGAATTTADSSQQQQKTLQQLLTAVSNLKTSTASLPGANISTSPSTTSTSISSKSTSSKTASNETLRSVLTSESRKSVPSPLSLIHEIKQNLNKKSDTVVATTRFSTKAKPQYVYTVPASSSVNLIQAPGSSTMTTGGGVLSLGRRASADDMETYPKTTLGRRHSIQERPKLQKVAKELESPNTNAESSNQITVFVDQEKSSTKKDCKVRDDNFLMENELFDMELASKEQNAQDSTLSELDLLAGNDLPQHEILPYIDSVPYGKAGFLNLSAQTAQPRLSHPRTGFTIQMKSTDLNSQGSINFVNEASSYPTSTSNHPIPAPLTVCSLLEQKSPDVKKELHVGEEGKHKDVNNRTESTLLQQCIASSATKDFNIEDVLQQAPETGGIQTADVVDLHPMIDEVGVQETVECADESGNEEQPVLFNKLPAYLYSGKVLSSGTTTSQSSNEYRNNPAVKGLKDLNHDPLIGSLEKEQDQEVLHYNKVPHYLRGGKVLPRMPKDLHSVGSRHRAMSSDNFENYPVLKRTPEGAVVNTKELFYSRLPSYYSSGRYHVVDTVTEPPPTEDVTVTPETMWKQDQEEKRKKREKKKKRKKKRKKQSKKQEKQLENDRLLYSKLPHYFLAGRRSLVPDRRASEQSYSSSLSDTSISDDQEANTSFRSRTYQRSYSPKRGRSASTNSWSSRSPSRSPDRSWRSQRYRVNSRSPTRRYSSSDSDYSTHRSKVTRKRRRSPYSSGSDWESKRRKKADDRKREVKNKAIQERRVLYVGGIDDSVSKNDLRRRFEKFGTIEEISLHFRRDRDSYAFITFRFTCDTFEAIEKGNSDVTQKKYTLCFGGRREFCQVEYADLDEAPESNQQASAEDDFDTLLKKAMRR